MNHGISALQGMHHVAQKSSRITLPLKSDNRTGLLLKSFREKFRFAVFALAGHENAAGAAPAALKNENPRGTSTSSVSSESAVAATAAMAHRIRIRMLLS